jgi:polysaccharide pyruvyl transferase WcaK-like protein
MKYDNHNISFIQKHTQIRLIKSNFQEIKKKDYDILMVNSDQTWNKYDNNFYDYGFLKFAENWTIPRFAYGASYGDKWALNKEDELIAKYLLKQFIGISVRERSAIEILQKKLNIYSIQVLDPTLLLNKKDYLKLIKNYKSNIRINENYIFSYIISPTQIKLNIVKKIALRLNYNVHFVFLEKNPSIQNFIYLISNCKAVITNSYHGTIFSIIFNKPFLVFGDPKAKRFESLGEIFDIKSRIINDYKIPDLSLLKIPLKINKILLNSLKKNSLIFLKKISKY